VKSLLADLTPADIVRDPFPHIVAQGPMVADAYAALSDSYPSFSRIAWESPPERLPNNRRYQMSAQLILDAPDLPQCWKDFVGHHSSPAFLAEVAALFRDHWPAALLKALDGRLTGHATARLSPLAQGRPRVIQDARFEVNTPVRQQPSSVRGAHLDTPNRIFSCLFYMRHPDDDSTGGDLVLYRWRPEARQRAGDYMLPDADVEAAATIPYRANQLVIFPQSMQALHGVSLRHPTPHLRRYVFITAELPEEWLAA